MLASHTFRQVLFDQGDKSAFPFILFIVKPYQRETISIEFVNGSVIKAVLRAGRAV